RKDGPFVCINSAALPRDLVESELFGHERGAFTGATQAKPGKFELASGGTVFLDEVGELAPGTQAKLLRVLEGQPFERVGGTKPIRVEVRVLAATNRDLAQAVQEGTFRADLYHRLNVIAIELPPLRERRHDITRLAEFFLEQLRMEVPRPVEGFSAGALALMEGYDWPGNVRELRNAVEYALVRGTTPVIQASNLPESVRGSGAGGEPVEGEGAPGDGLREVEKRHILDVYERYGRNKTKAAEALGISRDTLYRKLKEFQVE
ncbi:MAG: sigma 54-interacting transcriptional regulator, partial [Planctomycetes bacterium]|nr:sigma 54-interacting transcriptional regulator [Planctomycetota bacterium]